MRCLMSMGVTVVLCSCATARLERVATAELDRLLMAPAAPGIVFGAVWRDGTTVVRSAGFADLRSGRRVTDDTAFAWFSVTKLFTATAIMQLNERGQIDLDAPVSHYLPELHVQRRGRDATVRELLAHTAGLPNPIPVTWVHLADEPGPDLDSMVSARVGTNPGLDAIPGSRSAYSNLGYLLLGQIVARVSGERFERYVETHILQPLGCTASGFEVPSGRATAYQRKWSLMGIAARWMLDGRFFGESHDGYWELRPFAVDGAPYGGLNGPVLDLLRLGNMMLAHGEGAAGRVLSSESVRAMTAPSIIENGRPTEIGLGWHLGDADGEPFAYHIGGGGGYRSELRVYPRLGYAVAVLANETSFPTGDLARLVVR